jgi:hypothetical protein
MKTPEILHPAIRQYMHNDCSGLTMGFDEKETINIVTLMQKVIKAQSKLLTAYRTGSKPPEWVFATLEKARAFGIEL